MKALAELFIAGIDLVRAEGLELRRKAFSLGLTLAIVAVLAGTLLLGIALIGLCAYLALREPLGPHGAALACGVACVVTSGIGLWLVWLKNRAPAGRR